jgi:diguanylate cyclase (GGDEF)-like protein
MIDTERGARYTAGLAIVAVAALLLTPFYFQREIDRARELVTTSIDPARESASDVRLALAREVGAVRGYLLTRDSTLLSEYDAARQDEERALVSLSRVEKLEPRVALLARRVDSTSHAWNDSNDDLVQGRLGLAAAIRSLPAQVSKYRNALDAGEELEDEITRSHQRIRAHVLTAERRWTAASVVLAALAAVAATVVILMLRRTTAESTLARTDPLTTLFNRRGFDELAQRELSRARRNATTTTLLTFDIDNFKGVNDSQGHAAGDQLLRRVGAAIRETIRDIDVAARLGGDEFAILLPDNRAVPPERAVERVRDMIVQRVGREHSQSQSQSRSPVTLSVGAITASPGDNQAPAVTSDELVHAADRLMYQVKSAGKNAIRHEELTPTSVAR